MRIFWRIFWSSHYFLRTRTQLFSSYYLFFLILLYGIHVHCSLHITKWMFLCRRKMFKLFSSWETDRIPGGPVVKIPQKLHVVAFLVLESWCHVFSVLESCRGILSFCKIMTLIPPGITTSSIFSITVGCFLFSIY